MGGLWRLGILAAAVALPGAAGAAGDGRLLTVDAAEVLEHPILGLQRTAVPALGGFAVDTSLLADLALAPNLGLRWAAALGPHRLVAGARWTQFVGGAVYSSVVNGLQPLVKRFEPTFSGPTAYALYGIQFPGLLLQVEARYSHLYLDYFSLAGAGAVELGGPWSAIAELGIRPLGNPGLHAAAGVRFTGPHFGFSAGAAYLGLSDPLLPPLPFAPVLDLFWSFS